jgi:hypothetical protein
MKKKYERTEELGAKLRLEEDEQRNEIKKTNVRK